MPRHTEIRRLPFKPEEMYDLVANIELYPQFIPWCVGARIYKEIEKEDRRIFEADLVISFKIYQETFKSEVTLLPHKKKIIIRYIEGPLRYLESYWSFLESDNGCEVVYHVDFEFRSKIIQKLVGIVFFEAMQRIVNSFEKRAYQVYKVANK